MASTVTAPVDTATELVDAASLGRRPRQRIPLPRGVRRLAGPALVVLVWQLLGSLGLVNQRVLATPAQVVSAAWQLGKSGELESNLWASLVRVVEGLAVGVSLGVLLAVAAGLFRLGEDLIDSTMQVVRALPALGLLPLVIIWFGVGEEPKIALVAFATACPVYINTYAGIRGVEQRLVESARVLGLGRIALIRHVILPGAVPSFLVGLRFALTSAWLVMIVAEQLNATSGIGYLMNQAQAWFRTDIIVLGLLIYGLLGLAADALVRLLERRSLNAVSPSPVAVEARDVHRSFDGREVLAGVDLTIRQGEFVALLGRSGSGKSTLLRAMAGLDPDFTGTLRVPRRRSVVFQDHRLQPWKRVLGNVVLGLPRAGAKEAGELALAEVGLAERARDWPITLSGGESQRAALARALVRDPELLLLDEPFGALDALTRLRMHGLLRELCAKHRPAVLLVTHDVDEAVRLADRVLVLTDGRLGSAHDTGAPGLQAELLAELGVSQQVATPL
jgi:sulfonate transport system permease protein